MDLSTLTLDAFLCSRACVTGAADPGAFHMVGPMVAYLVAGRLRSLGRGFALHQLTSGPGDIGLLNGVKLIGFYFDELLAVDPAFAGRKLSVPLILTAAPRRAIPVKRSLSPAGRRSLEFAWRVAQGLEPNPWP